MVQIQTTAEKSARVRASRARVLGLIWDVPASGPWFPGVERIEALGEDRYRWVLEPRKTLGTTFKGAYVTQYQRKGDDEITWSTLEGNLSVTGRWRVSGTDGDLTVTVRVVTELDAPVPKIMKKPATLFAEKEAADGLQAQVNRLKVEAEKDA